MLEYMQITLKKQNTKRGVDMSVAQEYKLNIDKIINNNSYFISSKEALSDVTPMQWSEDIKNGSKKVILATPDNRAGDKYE